MRNIYLLGLFGVLFMQNVNAHPTAENWQFERLIDGDTLVFNVPNWPEQINTVSVRVAGIDTPESTWRADCPAEENLGLEAKAFVANLLANHKTINLRLKGWGKWGGRLLSDIYIDGKNLARELIVAGYAVEYDGGKKTDWCELLKD